jgi:hypothetical protein
MMSFEDACPLEADDLDQEEARLRQVAEAAFAAAKRKPTGVNRKAYRAAEKALEEFLRDRHAADLEPAFRNIPEMVAFLDGEGWRISDSSAYEHREQGKFRLEADGSIQQSAALEYARLHLKKKDGTPGTIAGPSLQEQKVTEEIARIRADRLQRELKYKELSGELMPRSRVEVELAARATDLKAYFDAVARSAAGRIVKIVGGDPQKVPDLIQFMLGMNRKAFDNYARPIQGIEEEEE